ncbi:hypothetical protein GE061_018897 [Apolygus lucorum]|uniref:tRNA (uracil(54)-C(5))-methyltransferase n=1 Tax=Apolygus lucorum TaxID=248454 RepID=A0A8S9X9I7_APOLU|nr:hypothetical protein GE061_018897 [Apolygus lucorum]
MEEKREPEEKRDMIEGSTEPENGHDKLKDRDEYAYKNISYTTEVFKLELRGLPKYYGIGQLRKFLSKKMNLNISKVKAPAVKSKWAYVCFPSAEERDKGLITLNGAKFKAATLQAKVADPAPDPFAKRKNEEAREGPNKRFKVETAEEQSLVLRGNVSPLWNMPYEEQLAQKMKEAKILINRLGVDLVKTNPDLRQWANEKKAENDGLICKLLDIKSRPEFIDKYRNKCEFTIGRNELNGKRTVGFRMGAYASGTIEVVPIDDVKFVPDMMKKSVKIFEKYVQESEFDVYSPETLQGNWKQLTVRVGTQTDQLMLVVGFHPQHLTEDELQGVRDDVKRFFVEGDGAELKVDSLYFEIIKRKDKGEVLPPAKLLHGKEFIQDKMCDLVFNISPHSFFQINTRCAELLIQTVKELADINDKTVVLDICCGIGTFGLCLAKDCKRVMGIEIVEEAVKDARINATQNDISNSDFFCGKAEDVITSVVKRVSGDRIVGIVDPPRAGLHKNAIQMLRKMENLDNFVYLACDCKSAFKNFTELGRAPSKIMLGAPFVPVAAVPVDMFPHTNHFEFVLYFERLQSTFQCEKNDQDGQSDVIKEESDCKANEE